MIPVRQIILILSLICFALLVGYVPAITSLTIPMIGSDITGLSKNLKPRSLSSSDLADIYFSLFTGSIFFAIAITMTMKHVRGKLISQIEKYRVFFLTFLTSITCMGFLWALLNPEINILHKKVIWVWLISSGIILFLNIIKAICKRILSKK